MPVRVGDKIKQVGSGTYPLVEVEDLDPTVGAVADGELLKRVGSEIDGEAATATPGANVIPRAGAGGKLASGFVSEVLAYADLTDDPVGTHAALTAAHGATGAVVGTTNTQTLSNKALTTPTIGDLTNATHAHAAAASGGALYSVGQYKWAPDAAPGATVTAGDHQGDTYHSGLSAETATRLYVDAETAPGASGLPITIQYGNTNDLDTVASWTTIATLTLSSEKSSYTDSMTNATIPADRVLRMNVGTVVGTPADVTVQLFIKRLLST